MVVEKPLATIFVAESLVIVAFFAQNFVLCFIKIVVQFAAAYAAS